MTTRVKGFIVSLEHDIRDDDVEEIANAIRMIKHVSRVDNVGPSASDFITSSREKDKIRKGLYEFIKDNL